MMMQRRSRDTNHTIRGQPPRLQRRAERATVSTERGARGGASQSMLDRCSLSPRDAPCTLPLATSACRRSAPQPRGLRLQGTERSGRGALPPANCGTAAVVGTGTGGARRRSRAGRGPALLVQSYSSYTRVHSLRESLPAPSLSQGLSTHRRLPAGHRVSAPNTLDGQMTLGFQTPQ
jgi:hypothetical protein